jgi:hypothetical protein
VFRRSTQLYEVFSAHLEKQPAWVGTGNKEAFEKERFSMAKQPFCIMTAVPQKTIELMVAGVEPTLPPHKKHEVRWVVANTAIVPFS